MADDDYNDDLDALTSLLDEDDGNPYDNGESFSVKSQHSQKVSHAVKKQVTSQYKKKRSVGSSQSSGDEEKSKQELIEELQRLRDQMSQIQGGTTSSSQNSCPSKSTAPKENFSDALFADNTPKLKQKKDPLAVSKKCAYSTSSDDKSDDGLSDFFDDKMEDEVKEKKEVRKATPQKAESLFKKNHNRQAHTPQNTTAPPKKVSPYKCKLCEKTFDNYDALSVHEFKHKVARCSCEICGKSFTSKLQLDTHLRTHTKPSAVPSSKSSPSEVNRSGGSLKNSSGPMSQGNGGGSQKSVPHLGAGANRKQVKEEGTCETEYFSRIRIMSRNPLVSSAVMKERMKERKMIRMSILNHYSRTGAMEGDWVTMGVLIRKISRSDSKGKPFSIWTLNDLSDLEENVSLFLFGKVHEEHWKTIEGSVIGLLNANIMEKRENTNYKDANKVQLNVDNPQKLLLMGKSKDFGRCRSTKKDGQPCTQIINTSDCQYCQYHVQAEYKKAGSKRTDLSSSYSGITPKSYLKKIQKDNIFYGGQSMSVPSMSVVGGGVKSQSKSLGNFKSNKLNLKSLGVKGAESVMEEAKNSVLTLLGKGEKEEDMLVKVTGASKEFTSLLKAPTPGSQNLVRHMVTVEKTKKNVASISANKLLKQHKQEMASKIAAHTLTKPSSSSSRQTLNESTKFNTANPPGDAAPMLGRGWSGGGDIDLGASPVRSTLPSKGRSGAGTLLAKQRALALIKQKGRIEKQDPNTTGRRKNMDVKKKEAVKRRVQENWKEDELLSEADSSTGARAAKKRKTFLGQDLKMSKDEMDKILSAKSSHAGLLAEHEAELMDRYFKEMEKKEGLENKLDSIREMKRRVVSCKECSFTWFFASDLCKKESHTLHWHEAMQRFFVCKDCNSRTIAFDRIPTRACRSCGSSRFERTTMLKERNGPKIGGETLLLRGMEEKYL